MLNINNKLKFLAFQRSFDLKKVDIKFRSIQNSKYVLVSCFRNEGFRLKYFIKYYKSIGVQHFLFIDNASSDNTVQILKNYKEVSLWKTNKSYKKSRFGMDWCNYLINKYCKDKWLICCDPDEFLIYPEFETKSLSTITRRMELNNQLAMNTTLIDCYSEKSISKTTLESSQSPFEVCQFFDKPNFLINENITNKNLWIRGGVRLRQSKTEIKAPAINKVCLVYNKKGLIFYNSSMHDLVPLELNSNYHDHCVIGAMMHFKFLSSLETKVKEELNRKQHYDGSSEYINYSKIIEETLYNKNISIKYKNSQNLELLGIIQKGKEIV